MTSGVNAAIAGLCDGGALRSSTLMACGARFAAALPLALARSGLGVGCHVVLVDGAPALPPERAPSLVQNGVFRLSLAKFLGDLARGRIRGEEIEAEAAAQIRRIQSSGLRVTHIDSHKHTHVFRAVLRPLLAAARACGVTAVRNPMEPAWSIAASPGTSSVRRLEVRALGWLGGGFARFVRKRGFRTTDGALGLAATGSLDGRVLRSLLEAMPDGDWELVCHPGYVDAELDRVRTRLRASREVERAALLEVVPAALKKDRNLALINFSDLE